MEHQSLDALVVGAGFGGIYQLKLLLDQGLTVKRGAARQRFNSQSTAAREQIQAAHAGDVLL